MRGRRVPYETGRVFFVFGQRLRPKAVIGDSRALEASEGYSYVPFSLADRLARH